VALSFHLLGSARLVRDTGARPVTAWGLSIGSIPMLAWFPPWTAHPSGDPLVVAGLTAIVAVAATTVAFSLSFASLSRITPTEFAVTSTLEPALAAVAAAVFLGVTLRAAICRRRPDDHRRPAARARRSRGTIAACATVGQAVP
jgi:drug/metabolite transporter (DMT)-like permease